MRQRVQSRAGFTIIELLVAATLCMFIMGILAMAFQRGIDTFRNLHAIGTMQEKLRAATNIMKRDLSAPHFGGSFRPGISGPYVSDQRMDNIGWVPPEEGYFFIRNASTGTLEGADGDGVWSTVATDHEMGMTVRLSGKTPDQLFYALAPQTVANVLFPYFGDYIRPDPSGSWVVASDWAEVRYFLVANGQFANGNPLYTLYRRQRILLPNSITGADPNYADLSQSGGRYNTPATVANRANRVPATPLSGFFRGDDILLSDVLSFEIKAHWTNGPASTGTPVPGTMATGNYDGPFDILPASPLNRGLGRRFDTWSRDINPNIDWYDTQLTNPNSFMRNDVNSAPLRIRLTAIQIKLRVWDSKTQQARQVTLVQDL